MKPTERTMEGKVSNYDIAQATGLWAGDVNLISSRVGATEYCIPVEMDGRTKAVEAYTLADALRIADYVKANPQVRHGGVHAPAERASMHLGQEFDRALKLMGMRI